MKAKKSNKFWNKISNSEIYIFGDICSEDFFESDVTSKKFAEDFNKCADNVTIHINSNGGDFFTALAISNLISQSQKNTTASIDGICASAATLISCACKKITMAENALMMIHAPSVLLSDFFSAKDLAKVEASLNKVRDSILTAYASRTGLDISVLQKMVEAETWMTAAEAKDFNFIDEITGAIDLSVNDNLKYMIFNSLVLNKNYFEKAKEKMEMENSILEKIKNLLTGDENIPDTKPDKDKNKNSDTEIENKIRAAELARIQNLNQQRCGNAAVNALIDVAIAEGKTVADIAKFISAVKNLPPEKDNVADKILNLIEDNLTSGAENVIGSDEQNPNADKKIQADLIAKFANGIV